jgi:hypothetical protein
VPPSLNPEAYRTERDILDRALLSEKGVRVQQTDDTSKTRAHNLRQRLNLARVADRKRNATVYPLGDVRRGTSDYDSLSFLLREDETGFYVLVTSSGARLAGLTILDLDEPIVADSNPGNRTSPQKTSPESDEFD